MGMRPDQIGSRDAPRGKQADSNIGDLLFDPDNPRLSGWERTLDQDALAERLWKAEDVEEVMLSIAFNGFYRTEPLLVVSNADGGAGPLTDKLVVFEGNRRLAAVRVLVDDNLRAKLGAAESIQIDDESKERLRQLPTVEYDSKEAIWAYLGFRHINGPKPWDSFSKAKHIVLVHETYGVPLDEISLRIGDRHSTVVRLYRGASVLRQAETDAGFNLDDRFGTRFAFSHLYTALDQPGFQTYLGIDPAADPVAQQASPDKLPELAQLMVWLYGKKSTNTRPLIRSQNPDLNRLREIVSNARALTALQGGRSLDHAFELSISDSRRFRQALTLAVDELQEARGVVLTGYEGEDDLYELGETSKLYADDLLAEMGKKRP